MQAIATLLDLPLVQVTAKLHLSHSLPDPGLSASENRLCRFSPCREDSGSYGALEKVPKKMKGKGLVEEMEAPLASLKAEHMENLASLKEDMEAEHLENLAGLTEHLGVCCGAYVCFSLC